MLVYEAYTQPHFREITNNKKFVPTTKVYKPNKEIPKFQLNNEGREEAQT